MWINPLKIGPYTEHGRKGDETGDKKSSVGGDIENVDVTGCNHSIKDIPWKTDRCVSIDCTPKCHPELAGEGIEYTWALTKLFTGNPLFWRKE